MRRWVPGMNVNSGPVFSSPWNSWVCPFTQLTITQVNGHSCFGEESGKSFSIVYICHEVIGSFFPGTWLTLQSTDSESENWLWSRNWSRDHDPYWGNHFQLMLILPCPSILSTGTISYTYFLYSSTCRSSILQFLRSHYTRYY